MGLFAKKDVQIPEVDKFIDGFNSVKGWGNLFYTSVFCIPYESKTIIYCVANEGNRDPGFWFHLFYDDVEKGSEAFQALYGDSDAIIARVDCQKLANMFGEGTYLEPDDSYGEGDIKIKRVINYPVKSVDKYINK